MNRRRRTGLLTAILAMGLMTLAGAPALAQTATATPNAPQAAPADTAAQKTERKDTAPPKDAAQPVPASPANATPPSATPPTAAPTAAPTPAPSSDQVAPKTPAATPEGVPLAPGGKPQSNEIEPNASPTTPENATTENVEVPARPIVAVAGQSSYDDAFKSIKASVETVKAAMDKAGIKPSGHPITIFSAPDDKGFKYQVGIPVAQKPEKTDLGGGVTVAMSPSGKAIKFQHRGPYDDIDSTYDVITAFLDAKGMQVDSPYIEEYLTDLTTADDPNLQVDIYVFVK